MYRVILTIFALVTFHVSTAQQPVRELVTCTVQEPDIVEKEKDFDISVALAIEPGWYIYAPTGTNAAQGMIETKVVFNVPAGISRTGKMQLTEPHFKNGYEVLEGDNIVMSQAFKAVRSGEYLIMVKVTYQSCSIDICLPPVTETFTTIVHVK